MLRKCWERPRLMEMRRYLWLERMKGEVWSQIVTILRRLYWISREGRLCVDFVRIMIAHKGWGRNIVFDHEIVLEVVVEEFALDL